MQGCIVLDPDATLLCLGNGAAVQLDLLRIIKVPALLCGCRGDGCHINKQANPHISVLIEKKSKPNPALF
jgi:hypothetical protein